MSTLPLEVVEEEEVKEFSGDANSNDTALIQFLQNDLALSPASIAMALRYCQQDRGPLPMILWRYGFVSLDQLNQIFDWLAR